MTLECAESVLEYYRECDKELGKVKAKWITYSQVFFILNYNAE